jgi:hypothetical protein
MQPIGYMAVANTYPAAGVNGRRRIGRQLPVRSGSALFAASGQAVAVAQAPWISLRLGQSCGENGGIRHGSTCTWVAISAFENGSHFKAPRTGTIKHVKLVSCKAGKFRLQLAVASPSTRKARIVANGPEITYKGQSPCSGGNGFLLYAPPLPVGGPLKKSHSGASCDLLVQLSYT